MDTLKRRSARRALFVSPNIEAASRHVRLCADVSRFLSRLLTRVPWSSLRYADRRRLDRALAQLGSHIALTRAKLAAAEPVKHSGS